MSLISVGTPTNKRLSVLYTYIKRNRNAKKLVIICCEVKTAEYFHELMGHFLIESMVIHEKQQHDAVITNLEKLRTEKSVVMFTTNKFINNKVTQKIISQDNYTFIQYDPPSDLEKFKVLFKKCHSQTNSFMLFLRPEEKEFLQKLKAKKIKVEEISYNLRQVADITPQVSKLVSTNYALHMAATEGYKAYMQSYNAHSLKEIFDIESLSFDEVAESFGFTRVPAVDVYETPKKISPAVGSFEQLYVVDHTHDNNENEKDIAQDSKYPSKFSKKNHQADKECRLTSGPKKVQMKHSYKLVKRR